MPRVPLFLDFRKHSVTQGSRVGALRSPPRDPGVYKGQFSMTWIARAIRLKRSNDEITRLIAVKVKDQLQREKL